jgi:hypothetical protein
LFLDSCRVPDPRSMSRQTSIHPSVTIGALAPISEGIQDLCLLHSFAHFTIQPLYRLCEYWRAFSSRVLGDSISSYGYVLTLNTAPPDKNLCDITHFARYRYGELADLEMPPVVKEVNTFIPGDYRSTQQVCNSEEIPGSNLVYTPEDTIEAIHELQRSFNGVRASLSP